MINSRGKANKLGEKPGAVPITPLSVSHDITAVAVEVSVMLDVTSCGLVDRYKRFRTTLLL